MKAVRIHHLALVRQRGAALFVSLIMLAVMMIARFLQGRWKTMTMIEMTSSSQSE